MSIHYSDYLQLHKILDSQLPESSKQGQPAHDEMLFIIIHQAYELWFKQLIYEIDSVLEIMKKPAINDNSPELQMVVHRCQRVVSILKLLVQQIDIMETMTPMDFLDFRDMLRPASGFQSWQFKLMEAKLGLDFDQRHAQNYYTSQLKPHEIEAIRRGEGEISLLQLINNWLERMPFFREGSNWQNYQSLSDIGNTPVAGGSATVASGSTPVARGSNTEEAGAISKNFPADHKVTGEFSGEHEVTGDFPANHEVIGDFRTNQDVIGDSPADDEVTGDFPANHEEIGDVPTDNAVTPGEVFWRDYRFIYQAGLAQPESANMAAFDEVFGTATRETNPSPTRKISTDASRAALFIMLYRGYPMLQTPFQLLNSLLEIDEQMSTWRYRHMSMVHRTIGTRMGTGGSTGRDYLRGALEKHYIFADIAKMTSFLIERRKLPQLSQEMETRLGFFNVTSNQRRETR